MSKVRVEIDIEKITRELKKDGDKGVLKVAQVMAAQARKTQLFQDTPKPKPNNKRMRKRILALKSKYKDGGGLVSVKVPHGHLVVLGHRLVTKNGVVIGHVAPRNFLEEAERIVGPQAEQIMRDYFINDIEA